MARKCFSCKKKDEPEVMFIDGLKATCRTPECMAKYSLWKVARKKKNTDKAFNKETKRLRVKAGLDDTVPIWTKKAQKEFNKYIRLRDKNQPCISCGNAKFSGGHVLYGHGVDCGHYRSVGSAPELRFEELNAHAQCVNCNRDKSGNIVEYRIELARRIGPINLEWLEGPHEAKRYRVPDLKEIHAEYKLKVKELENESNRLEETKDGTTN